MKTKRKTALKKKVKQALVVSGSNDFIVMKKTPNGYQVESVASGLFNRKKSFKQYGKAKTFLRKEVLSYLEGQTSKPNIMAKQMMKSAGVQNLK